MTHLTNIEEVFGEYPNNEETSSQIETDAAM